MTTRYFLTHMHAYGMTQEDVVWLLAQYGTLPARVLDFRVSRSLSVNELGRSVVFTERWQGLSELR